MKNRLDKVVFLDRDGVINRDSVDYVKSWQEFEFLPGSLEAIRRLTENGFCIIIITNQSAINRKIFTYDTLTAIHSRMLEAVRSNGGRITDIFFCPHAPQENCDCRKPKPGMILKARQKYNIDLAAAFMVGDNVKDIECARNAGCGRALLVKTGNGRQAEEILAQDKNEPDFVAANLLEAADWIISRT